jgi:uncharacterized protein (TIGR02145 family)
VPTQAEYNALLTASTTKTWATNDGINGMTYTTTNGTLFFPAAGVRYGSTSTVQTTNGLYWSSEQSAATTAYMLYFTSTDPGTIAATGGKSNARSIRCVRPKIE